MGLFIFFLILFIILVGGGLFIGRSVGGFVGKKIDSYSKDKPTYIDNSVHHHYHNHTHDYAPKTIQSNTHHHIHQHLTVIDEETHQRGLDHFNKKEDRHG